MGDDFKVSIVIDGLETKSIILNKDDFEETGEIVLKVSINPFLQASVTQED